MNRIHILYLYILYTGILWSNGQAWKDLRKFTAVTLRDFGVGKRSLEERTLEESRHLVSVFREKDGASFSPKRALELVIANIICGIVFGQRWVYKCVITNIPQLTSQEA